MLPVTHTDLLIVLACTIAMTVLGFSFLGILVYRSEVMVRQAREDTKENIRISRAVAGLVYPEEEKTRALLREHGWPGPSRDP
jgi:hypothetical protein